MKLLYILPEYLPQVGGGIITFYRMLLPQLVAMGHHVKVIIGSGVVSERVAIPVTIDGVCVEVLDASLHSKYRSRFARFAAVPGLRSHLAAAWALREQARNGEGYDAVEATDWGLLVIPWVLEEGPPAVVQLHGSCGQIDQHDPMAGEELQGDLIRLVECQAFARADRIQSYSLANAQFWRNQVDCKVDVIKCGWQSLRQHAIPTSRTVRGLVVGRVQRWKGPQVLCAALCKMGNRAPTIDWVGRDTSYADRTKTTGAHLAEAFPEIWNRRVVHRPQQAPEEVGRLQEQASFVVVPSTWDMFNFTCVEAMGAGTPVICSTGAGASELIQDGTNGFVFTNGDADSLASSLDRLLALTPVQRQAIGEAGRQTVLRELRPETSAELRAKAYRDLTAPRRVAPQADDWLRRACSPRAETTEEFAFLDHLPLKGLAQYVGRRTLTKIRR